GVALEMILIYFAHDVANINLYISKLTAAGIVFFWNYGARRFFIFGAVKSFNWRRVPGLKRLVSVFRKTRQKREKKFFLWIAQLSVDEIKCSSGRSVPCPRDASLVPHPSNLLKIAF